MPTVLANTLLGYLPDRTVAVRGKDRVGVASPMFNEEAGAEAALSSLLRQTEPFDELAVSVNGGTDATLKVVASTLTEHGFTRVYQAPAPDFIGNLERWHRPGGPAVVVLEHAQPISKADSINKVIEGNYLNCERVLVVDGDTLFADTFLERLKDEFYRLRRERVGKGWRYVIEDIAIQSGAVTSRPPDQVSLAATLISRGRAGEYAIAALLRAGQTARIGKGPMFGQSRLYTVVGCGFVARKGSFPMPSDTLTEDHDFTLQVQNEETTEQRLSGAELQQRGFRVRTAQGYVDASAYFDSQDEVVVRRSGAARFVPSALMYTEDPPTVPGYMRQVERWNGGGVENAIKRMRSARRSLKPNVAFAAYSAQFENLFGLALLMLLLPVALGVNSALPGYGTALDGLLLWIGFDLVATLVLVFLGFRRLWRQQGDRGLRLLWRSTRSAVASALPLLVLRPLNAIAYIVGATRVVPKALKAREIDPSVTITWERPRALARNQVGTRVTAVASSLMLGMGALFSGAFYLADASRPGYKDTWLLLNHHTPIVAEEHIDLPLMNVVRIMVQPPAEPLSPELAEVLLSADGRGGDQGEATDPTVPIGSVDMAGESLDGSAAHVAVTPPVGGEQPGYLSAFCSVEFTANPAAERRLLAAGAAEYQPLTYWQRLVLARLVPLAAHIEEASTAYDLPPRLLLQVLINESFLDPLAVGPTEDLGLSQVTGDALTLLRAISTRSGSHFENPVMFSDTFNVFDPDFSICAGAAKLAWARAQPHGHDDHYAYARYINPLEGVQRSGLNPVHAELVRALDELVDTVDALRSAFALYLEDPSKVTNQERALLDVYSMVARGELGISGAYLAAHSLTTRFGIDDDAFYKEIADRLYGMGNSTVLAPRSN